MPRLQDLTRGEVAGLVCVQADVAHLRIRSRLAGRNRHEHSVSHCVDPPPQGSYSRFSRISSTVRIVRQTAEKTVRQRSLDPATRPDPGQRRGLRVLSLFSGIGGLDLGLREAGHEIVGLCESWEPARRVLRDRFAGTPLFDDVVDLRPQVKYQLLAAGFPCTDLSHAGGKAGIFGPASGLVSHVFRIAALDQPEWILLENVPNLLTLHAGAAMRYITSELEGLGYRWAYRTVDARTTGLPQRRPRVLLLASRVGDPAPVLLTDHRPPAYEGDLSTTDVQMSSVPPAEADQEKTAWGFYWTEGRNGLGLVEDAIPTLKGGSTLGLPSAPAVWVPDAPIGRRFVLPTIEDGEALQGFPRGWTAAAAVDGEPNHRWKLVGNAVPTGLAEWVGGRLAAHSFSPESDGGLASPPPAHELERESRWPKAGYGSAESAWGSAADAWPCGIEHQPLRDVVAPAGAHPLSHRAVTGFLKRLDESGRVVPTAFYTDLEEHQAATRPTLPRGVRSSESWASSPSTRDRMQRQRQRDTKPELRLRQALRARGIGYRLQRRPEPSVRARLDIVCIGAKVAVDVRGCFWHSCPEHGSRPRVNADRWADKLARNVARDTETVTALEHLGWEVIVVWEHDDPDERAEHIANRVRSRRSTGSRRNAPQDSLPLSDPAPIVEAS